VQESLTNIQKHARAVKQIRVTLAYSLEAIHLVVSDDGQSLPDAPSAQSGYGLKGLRERSTSSAANFCCGPDSSHGFQVDVSIPLQEIVRDQSLLVDDQTSSARASGSC